MSNIFQSLSTNPIIASITNLDNLELALDSTTESIFLMKGNIFNLKDISQRVKSRNKGLYISIDSIDGFTKDTFGLEYIARNIEMDGIITRKKNLVKLCRDMGIFTIEKIEITDSQTFKDALISLKELRPHAIDLYPGVIPKIIEKISKDTMVPIIASGLIEDSKDIEEAIKAGAIGVSSSNTNLWNHKY